MGGISAVVPGVTETSGVAVAISPDVDGTGSTLSGTTGTGGTSVS